MHLEKNMFPYTRGATLSWNRILQSASGVQPFSLPDTYLTVRCSVRVGLPLLLAPVSLPGSSQSSGDSRTPHPPLPGRTWPQELASSEEKYSLFFPVTFPASPFWLHKLTELNSGVCHSIWQRNTFSNWQVQMIVMNVTRLGLPLNQSEIHHSN